MAAVTVGALVAGRRPRHPVGWLLVGLGLTIALSALSAGYANYGVPARPGTLPAVAVAVHYQGVSILGAAGLLGFVLLLTPTGRLPSPAGGGRPDHAADPGVAVAAPAGALTSCRRVGRW
jgi:hypothetical protein